MYNCRTDLRKLSILGIAVLLGLQNQVFGSDLTEDIASQFQKYYNGGLTDKYISRSYSSTFPKDPFGDSMSNVEDMSMQLKVAGVQYVKGALEEMRCTISNKKIWAILYYFVPEFRAEIARSLKMNMGDFDSKKYVFNEDTILKYCKEYYACEKVQGKSARQVFTEDVAKEITASSPADIKTNCKEFFVKNYREGQANEQRMESTQMAQIGSDRYWNETTKDSPYDIMVDLGVYSKLLYQDAEEPTKPVFYDLDIFKDSKASLKEDRASDGTKPDNGREKRTLANGGVIFPGGSAGGGGAGGTTRTSSFGGQAEVSLSDPSGTSLTNPSGTSLTNPNGTSLSDPNLTRSVEPGLVGGSDLKGDQVLSNANPLPLEGEIGEGGYDSLIEGLSAFSIPNNSPNLQPNLCGDGSEEEPEAESEEDWTNPSGTSSSDTNDPDIAVREIDEFSAKDYQDLVDYMTDAVDEYCTLPEDREEAIEQEAGDTSKYVGDSDAGQLANSANKIKNCWKSCNDLRLDLKAECMIKCACGQIKSPIFDPDKIPGLGPIFVIRYCSVPSTDTRFSKGGKRIHSIEEGLKEIYGAVDKLSREGRLGIWTQQYNFLDSSTKKMKIADSFAFSIDIEFVDLADKMGTQSDQYKEKQLKDNNRSWQSDNGVANPLNNPAARNAYRVVGDLGEKVGDYSAGANADMNRKAQADLDMKPRPLVDPIDNTDAYRYNIFASNLGRFMDQQGTLWTNISSYQSEMSSYAEMLYAKEKRRANDARFNKSE